MQINPSHRPLQRRSFLRATGTFAVSAAVVPTSLLGQKIKEQAPNAQDYEVSATESLMREHGILNRVLLIYSEVARRIEAREDFPPQIMVDSADIVRKYIEDHHQKLEEEHIFPLFRTYYGRQDVLRLYAQKLLDLVDVLGEQHQASRRLTDRIISSLPSLKTSDDRQKLAQDLRAFVRMYTPHVAREDTVLFPALPVIITHPEFRTLSERFQEIEHKTFGGEGFDIYLDYVTAFEKRLGIYDLKQFTPK
jgi:hemerythrin-like domain-containing protein